MSHNNNHDHAENTHGNCSGHHHAVPSNYGYAFIIAILLNSIFVVVEFSYGLTANSTALMADAGHNLSDVLGLLLAWAAFILSKKAPNKQYTYGLRSTTILAALANAMFLLIACGVIALEAIKHFSQPPVVEGMVVTIVATIGIFINGISAYLFIKGSKGDLNIRGAYLHMAADAAVSFGVVIAGVVIAFTGWSWIDPIIGLVIVAVIVFSTWGLLRDSLQLALSAIPTNINVSEINNYLRQINGVVDIHDLHIWGISTTENALTVHLIIPNGYPGDDFMDEIAKTLKSQFSIHHSTLQIEQGTTGHTCSLK